MKILFCLIYSLKCSEKVSSCLPSLGGSSGGVLSPLWSLLAPSCPSLITQPKIGWGKGLREAWTPPGGRDMEFSSGNFPQGIFLKEFSPGNSPGCVHADFPPGFIRSSEPEAPPSPSQGAATAPGWLFEAQTPLQGSGEGTAGARQDFVGSAPCSAFRDGAAGADPAQTQLCPFHPGAQPWGHLRAPEPGQEGRAELEQPKSHLTNRKTSSGATAREPLQGRGFGRAWLGTAVPGGEEKLLGS